MFRTRCLAAAVALAWLWVKTTLVMFSGGELPIVDLSIEGGSLLGVLWLLLWSPLLLSASCAALVAFESMSDTIRSALVYEPDHLAGGRALRSERRCKNNRAIEARREALNVLT